MKTYSLKCNISCLCKITCTGRHVLTLYILNEYVGVSRGTTGKVKTNEQKKCSNQNKERLYGSTFIQGKGEEGMEEKSAVALDKLL